MRPCWLCSCGKTWSAGWLLFVYALAATLGVVSGGAMGAIGLGGALILALLIGAEEKRFPRPSPLASGMAALFLVLAVGSTAHALDPAIAQKTTLRMLSILLPLLLLSDAGVRTRAAEVFPAFAPKLAVLLGLGFLALDAWIFMRLQTVGPERDFMISKLNRGFSYGALLAFPLLAALPAGKGGRGPRLFLLACLLLSMGMTGSRATLLGLGAAGVVLVGASLLPALTLGGLRAVTLLLAAWPFAARYLFDGHRDFVNRLPESWHARIEIWDYWAHRIMERPWGGYGLGNSHLVDFATPNGAFYLYTKGTAAHPHNAICQLWGEMGIGGLIWGLAAALLALTAAARLPARVRPYALAAFALGITLLLMAYNLWTDSLWSAMALTALGLAGAGGKIKASLSASGAE